MRPRPRTIMRGVRPPAVTTFDNGSASRPSALLAHPRRPVVDGLRAVHLALESGRARDRALASPHSSCRGWPSALGGAAGWFVLAAALLMLFARAIDIECWGLLIPGGSVAVVSGRSVHARAASRRPSRWSNVCCWPRSRSSSSDITWSRWSSRAQRPVVDRLRPVRTISRTSSRCSSSGCSGFGRGSVST